MYQTSLVAGADLDVNLDQPFVIDRPASKRYPIYTRANVGEINPKPVSPLTYTTQAGMLFELAWRKALVRFGAFDEEDFDPDKAEFLGIFYGYSYLNLSVQRVFGVRMPGASPDLIDRSFFGTSEGVPPYERDRRDESPRHTERVTEVIAEILTTTGVPALDGQWEIVSRLRAERPDHAAMSDEQLWEYARPLLTTTFAEMMEEHMFITSAAAIPVGTVQSIAASLGDPGMAMRALAGLGDVASAQPTYEMWDLSRLIARSAVLTAAFDAGIEGLLDTLRRSDEDDAVEFLRRLDEFLYKYGARCPNEMDVGSPSWETDPAQVLVPIERMRLQPDAESPRLGQQRLAADRCTVTANMMAQLAGDPGAQAQLGLALRAAAVWLPARERNKFHTVVLQHEARMALMELGRRMVEIGVFDVPNDYVMLTVDEFPDFLGDPQAFAAEIRRRRNWVAALEELEPPFITVGVPPPPSTWQKRTVNALPAVLPGEVIAGIAACPGTAVGTARVIDDPVDGGDLEPGDVLVAASTDPAWTALFVSAAAVVVDVGAPLSHAAIVSRELGVPCVVSATNASRRIPNGARIRVDGFIGTVTIESVPAPDAT